MQTEIDPRDLIGHKAVDRNGDKIGTIDEVYLDDATGEPEWAAVRTGLFGRDAFVPLTTSEFISEELRVPYDKSQVKDSPDFGVGQHLSPAQELQLYRYYGLDLPAGAGHDGSGSGSGHGNGAVTGAGDTRDAATKSGMAAPAAAAATMAATDLSKPEPSAAQPTAQSAPAPQPTMSAPAPQPTMESTQPMPAATAPPASSPASSAGRTAAFMASPQSAPAPAAPAEPAAAQPATGSRPASTAGAGTSAAGGRTSPDPLTGPAGGRATGADAAGSPVPEPIEFVCREERLDISTEWSVLGHARLRKYVTTEQVERRVPVIRERIRVERVPVGADEREQLTDQEIAESTEEVTLHEERVVVRKAVVPVERIRLVTERFTEEQIIRDELHREHIQVQDSTRVAGPTAVPGSGGGSAPSSASSSGSPAPGASGSSGAAGGSGQGSAQTGPGAASMRPEPFPRTGDTGHAIGA